ncbi:rhamnogalacturonan lyase [Streptomyces poonensis]|uniref:Rhamnogalacturonan lyase n=1 Tax=Streptomyces poonensis TaxID=68255 RepID=A0A918PEX2_9ACTN|nr:rhamnogalacturonan lyase [Streptomyces poonensis]GGZ04850.1 rhamnogalacturonan lyase [Streptomyces poonensis]GLJ89432.1 rhamnogalacturonan lyase [Streptomyces poonensis]
MQHPRKHRRRRARAVLAASAAVAALAGAGLTTLTTDDAQAATARQVEKLDRGVVSVYTGSGNLVSWRWLATDPADVSFNVYRAGTKVNSSPITGSTNYFHSGAPNSADYTVRAIVNGVEQGDSVHAIQFRAGYKDVPISAPAGGTTPDGVAYTYEANDASVGDLDGDGALEFVLKWQPTNAKDNSQSGYTGNTIVDAVKLDGTRLWRIDLGRNIRSGAHYTQFQVYDYDGDGKAEVAMKTSDGTKDGTGAVIGSSSADHRNSSGYVLSGPEYLTMFNGQTGKAMQSVDYVPARGTVSSWGDSYGNRVDRFLAGTAYLDGARPSLIMARGYYTRSVIAAWDWRNGQFTRRWTFDTNSSTNSGKGYDGQGSHSLSVGDVDNDGKDEIVYGSMAVDDNGNGLWTTKTGHGDAQHLGDLDPSTSGLEYYKVSESTSQPAAVYINPANGSVKWKLAACCDNGRGVAGDIYSGNDGAEAWSSSDTNIRDESGATKGREPSSANFLSWWDGDTTRELLDGTKIDKYGTSSDTRLLTGSGVSSNNGTKSTPALSGDILGDWREEVVWRTSDNKNLRIYSTPVETSTKITTLLHDTMYRTGLAWQNTAYNQPPHPSFFIGNKMATAPRPSVYTP